MHDHVRSVQAARALATTAAARPPAARIGPRGSAPALASALRGSGARLPSSAVQRLAAAGGRRAAAPLTAQRIRDVASSGGRPIDAGPRATIERHVGADLSAARVHTGEEAHALAEDAGATAFTTGSDIFFRRGAYDPGSGEGLRTLAHEAVHVVQQQRGEVAGTQVGDVAVSEEGDAHEREAEAVAQRLVDGPPAAVQRACGCGGSCGGCGGEADEPVQRAATPTGALAVQRKKHGADPLGGSVVQWDPRAQLDVKKADGSAEQRTADIGEEAEATFADVPRDSTSTLTFPVAMSWQPKGAPGPGPGPAPKKGCDVCSIVQDAATRSLGSFIRSALSNALPGLGFLLGLVIQPVTEALGALLGSAINILPADLVKRCKDADVDQAIAELQQLKAKFDKGSCDVLLDPGTGLDICTTIEQMARFLVFFPPLTPFALSFERIKSGILKAFSDSIGEVIDELVKLRKTCGKQGPPPGPGGVARGQATTTMRVKLFTAEDGSLRVVGPGPAVMANGTGASVVMPVDASKDSTGTGAFVVQVPTLKSTDGTAVVGRQFSVVVDLTKPPQPLDITCPTRAFGPFVIGSDKFMDEPGETQDVHDWYFGLEPHVRDALESGAATIKITGRASSTGAKDYNLKLAEKRARHVERIVRDFAGSDSHLRSFALGEFGAQTPDSKEDAGERRVDVELFGQVPAEDAGKVEQPMCEGHLGKTTDGGASGPVDDGGLADEPAFAFDEVEALGGEPATSTGEELDPFFEPAFA